MIVPLISKISNLYDPDPTTSQRDRDGQTDGRHAISIPRYSASRGKNKFKQPVEAISYLIVCELWQVTAYYIYTSDTDTDRFSFIVRLPESFDIGSELEFAVRFDAGTAATYWDNNSGDNYRVKCLTRASFALPTGCNTDLPSLPWQQLI